MMESDARLDLWATPNFSPVFNFFEVLTPKGLTTLASQVTQFQPGIALNNYLL